MEAYGRRILSEMKSSFVAMSEGSYQEAKEPARRFARACGAMGRLIEREPRARDDRELVEFVRSTADEIRFRRGRRLISVHQEVQAVLEDDWEFEDRYLEACELWSNLVFMRELYAGTDAFTGWEYITEQDPVFEHLLRRGESDGGGYDVPADIPARHYWWWYPDAPPSDE